MIKANIALYTVWSGESLAKDAAQVVDGWLGGRSTHFVVSDEIGIAIRADWRKVLVDLNTMEVLAADSPSGEPMAVDAMIKKCGSGD